MLTRKTPSEGVGSIAFQNYVIFFYINWLNDLFLCVLTWFCTKIFCRNLCLIFCFDVFRDHPVCTWTPVGRRRSVRRRRLGTEISVSHTHGRATGTFEIYCDIVIGAHYDDVLETSKSVGRRASHAGPAASHALTQRTLPFDLLIRFY